MLEPTESLFTEPGSMMFMGSEIDTNVECGCGGIVRVMSGEPCVKVELSNTGGSPAYVGLTPNFPAKIVPVELSQSGRMIGKTGAIMSSLGDVNIGTSVDCCPHTACFSGLGCIRQALEGEGTAFVAAGGTILTKVLADGETLRVDSDAVVAYSDSVSFGVRPNGPLTACFGGEGCCNTTMTGPGTVVVQSMSFPKWKKTVAPPPQAAPAAGPMDRGAGVASMM